MASAVAGLAGQGGQHDHEVERGRLDVGDQAGADLPAEARAVDPGPELVEPALVDLAGVEGEAEAAEPGVGGGGERRRRRRRRAATADRRGRGGAHAERQPGHDETERRPAREAAGDEPGGRRPVAVAPGALGQRCDRRQHGDAAGGPGRAGRRDHGDDGRGHGQERVSWVLPSGHAGDPRNGAPPKAKIPPSLATSQ